MISFASTTGILAAIAHTASSKCLLVHLHGVPSHDGISLYEDLTEHSREAVHAYLRDKFAPAQASFVAQLTSATARANMTMPRAFPLWIQNTVILYDVEDTVEALQRDGSVNHDYAFWVPVSQNATALTPDNADLVGHGTHTMGSAVGSGGIGIAPNATWIAARPFNWVRETFSVEFEFGK
ncbi:hypothetical protein B5M09_013258 [Aphanomyces astaci]|uniref:subtilisin n=1 Tax=Aphanomyces astaci TaxID=112090 RepID=A0A3R7WMA6_APHAT|nr:hypothetical protein B5M09_013258 [Aphanomyces astaci]